MEDLKPCPFCEGEAAYWCDRSSRDCHIIDCGDCGCSRSSESYEGVHKDWNTRWGNRQQTLECIEKHRSDLSFYISIEEWKAAQNMKESILKILNKEK